jgi:hypothetical protein
VFSLLLCILLSPRMARPAVTRLEIERRESFASGHAFGRSGPYEKLTGKASLEVDPDAPANALVHDLELAPRNPEGKVEFSTEFCLLKPIDPSRGNRRLFYGVNNRGNKLALGAFNDRGGNDPNTLEDAGNGFLMRQGYSILWCGWNGDVRPGDNRLTIDLPVARDNGAAITGRIHAEIRVDRPSFSEPFYWGNSDPYPAVSLDHHDAVLTMCPRRGEPEINIPHNQWAFARWENGRAVPDPKHLHVKKGFRPGWLYDLVYEGKDPRVTGLGLVAVRDVVSFFRHTRTDRRGHVNPLGGMLDRAYVFGISQSGRFIHHFIYEGFNADARGRLVFDGAMPHVGGAGRGLFNARFAQTTRHGSQHEGTLYPSDVFPFNSVPQTDSVTGARGDILARARKSGHVPKIFFTGTSTEYWARAASLLHTDVEGKRDVDHDENVRIYFIAGAQHGVSSSPTRGMYQHPVNILDHRPVLRALLTALDRWVSTGTLPPASTYPRIDDGTLVAFETHRQSFPTIPDVRIPEVLYTPQRLDFGPRWQTEGIADHVPPKVGPAYRTLVPAVDADGNERAGIRLPDVAVPLATYAGWNLRGADCGAEGMLARWSGSYLAFPRTPEERQRTGDPRPSVQERYPTREVYLARLAAAAIELREQRFLLDEDVVRILRIAAAQPLWNTE